MNDVAEFLAHLRQLNIKLWVEDDRLRYRAPKGTLTSELTEQLRARKVDILAFLTKVHAVDVIPPAARQEHYALSHAQRRLWVLWQLEEHSAAYNLPLHLRLEGLLDRQALEDTFAHLIERHESLRTTFLTIDGEPRQRIHERLDFSVRSLDLTADPEAEKKLGTIAHEETSTPFDLEKGPLLRACLVKLADTRHILFFSMHHIISDGLSIGVLVQEFGHLYNALRNGLPVSLPDLPIHYKDYAVWQNRFLQSNEVAPHREYWHQQLSGTLPVLNLPLDFPRPAVQTFYGKRLHFVLDRTKTAELLALSRQHNASLFMLLTAIVKVLLYRYSGQTDIIVGSPIAGRHHPDLERQIGFYLNMLPLRDQVRGDMPFTEFLHQVRQTATSAYDHQVYPFDKLVDELQLRRDLSRSPLFDVLVLLQNTRIARLDLEDLHIEMFPQELASSLFDLTFEFQEQADGLLVSFEYNTDLFADDRIERMREHFKMLVTSIISDPAQRLDHLSILPESERRQLLEEFNATATPYPHDQTIVDLFEAQVEQIPNHPAILFREHVISYRELNTMANRIAHFLRERYDVQPDERVGVLVDRSPHLIAALLGILKAGGTYVPVDPLYPPERIQYILENSACQAILTETHYRELLAAFPASALCEIGNAVVETASNPSQPKVNTRLAYVTYTSGSTGKPKGVMITHRNVVCFQSNMESVFGCRPSDRILALTTVTFDISVLELLNSLMTGMTVVISPDAEMHDPESLLQEMRAKNVSVLQVTPSRLKLLLEGRDVQVLEALNVLLIGGEPLPKDLFARLTPVLDRVAVYNVYGPTETTIWSTCKKLHDGILNIGSPLRNESICVLSANHTLAPIGITGEICIGGDGVARGYYGQPDRTAERFIPHPFQENQHLYKTGDLGRWLPDGTLECLGRNDDQVKIRGYRVELGEIEHQLLRHDAVQEAVVVATEDQYHEQSLAAYIVHTPHISSQTLQTELRELLQEVLPDYMVPSRFVALERLPLTPNGKVDKKALPEINGNGPLQTSAYMAPRDAVEREFARIWQEILRVERVGVHDNFLELGGHSLSAIRVVSRIQRDLGIALRLIDVFRHQTIAGLAEVARQRDHGKYTALLAGEEPKPANHPIDDIAPITAEERELLNV